MNLRTSVRIKIKKMVNGKMVYKRFFPVRYSETRKRFLTEVFRNIINRIKFDKNTSCDITVYYDSKRKFNNNGRYDNLKDALYAFESFTEQDLIKDFWDRVFLPKRLLTRDQRTALKRTMLLKQSKVAPVKKSL